MHFFFLNRRQKLNKNCKNTICLVANILETAGNIAKSSQFHVLLSVGLGMIIGLKLYRKKYFYSKLTASLRQEKKKNFGSKFGGGVSFHTTILQS